MGVYGKGGKRRTIAKLVAEAFAGPKPPKAVPVYIDGDRTNVAASNIQWGKKWFPPKYADRDVEASYWSYVDKRGPDECWPWIGGRNFDGYGAFHAEGKRITATHYALQLAGVGRPVAPLCALHKCDNPPCVNPAHLFIGTKLDNKRDQLRKGRHPKIVTRHGEQNHYAKLTEAQVREIRASTESGMKMGARLGVSASAICSARRGKTWKHVK